MLWEDIYLSKDAPNDALRAPLAESLGVRTNAVRITDTLAQTKVGSDVQVVCEVTRLDGEFPLLLSIYLNDPKLNPPDAITVAQTLCKKFAGKALIDDRTDNPYLRVLVSAEDAPATVELNARLLDDDKLALKDPSLLWPLDRSAITATLNYLLEVASPVFPKTAQQDEAIGKLIVALQRISDSPAQARPDVGALRQAVLDTKREWPAAQLEHPYLAELLRLADGLLRI